ncbi:hypothetical protein GCM10010178_57890 [Lentzea flava]|uniref:Uncharacterized protein n=1 Tax=Lentzea flava TaxID=103732 RepID=A0ABQ2UXC9_9PSEU|nr:hypothetical protein GCM10010178_57890 [Lentzea flava]
MACQIILAEIDHDRVDGIGQRHAQRPVQPHRERAAVSLDDALKITGGMGPEIEHAESTGSFSRDHEGRVRGAERTQAQHPFSIRQHVHCARFLTVQGWGERNSVRYLLASTLVGSPYAQTTGAVERGDETFSCA